MRVLFVTNMYPTEAEPWIGCFVKDLEEDLTALGFNIRVFAFDGRSDWKTYIRVMPSLRSLIRRERVDLIHAHYGLTGVVALTQRDLPVVTTFYGPEYTGQLPWQTWISYVVARLSTPIVVSPEGALRLRSFGASVIPSGVDMELFQPIDRNDARCALGWSQHRRYVLFPSARMRRGKGTALFDAAFAELSQVDPDVEAVSLEGYTRADTALVLSAVDVMLVTSYWEGSPRAVRESLACMTPVVSVPVGDVAQVLEALPGCAVLPRGPQALARGVLESFNVSRDPALRRRAAETCRRRMARLTADVYSRAARKNNK